MKENFCKKIENLIKSCDLFYSYITFRIEDEVEYKSLIGGITTIFFL